MCAHFPFVIKQYRNSVEMLKYKPEKKNEPNQGNEKAKK